MITKTEDKIVLTGKLHYAARVIINKFINDIENYEKKLS